MTARDDRLTELRREIGEVDPQEARAASADGSAVLLDVREPEEVAQGSPADALRLGRSYLELRIEDSVGNREQPIHVICGGGSRSLFAADDLRRMGYHNVRSVAGGFNRWKNEGLPYEMPRVLDAAERARYARQISLPEVGEAGQARLAQARVLLIGAGGLGSPAALYLAAAGVGTLGIVDHDEVDRSNLQRQILHTDARVGMAKTESARQSIAALNPSVQVETWQERLSSANIERVFAGYDVIVDGSDNFPTRYLVNDACVKLGLPNVHGAVFRFEGQTSVFWPAGPQGGPCYRCLYPEPPPPEQAPSCAEGGVMGVLPGLIGMIQALETLKIVLGIGETLAGRLLCVDGMESRFRELRVRRDPQCPLCAADTFPGYIDYEQFCQTSSPATAE